MAFKRSDTRTVPYPAPFIDIIVTLLSKLLALYWPAPEILIV
jgi:hypothetical protein